MHFYPAYRLRDVMAEYAVTFYALLNEAYRQEHENYLMLSSIALLPNSPVEERTKFMQQLQWASSDPGDILNPSDDYSGIADVRNLLGK